MSIPIIYRKSTENPLASYSFTDIIEGTGIISLYAFAVDAGAGALSYVLDRNAFAIGLAPIVASINYPVASEQDTISASSDGTAIDFSLSALNAPRTLRGSCFVRFTYAIQGTGATGYSVVSIVKNSTVLVSGATTNATGDNTITTSAIKLAIPSTNCKRGDVIKLRITPHNSHASNTMNYILHHNPMNANWTTRTPNVTASTNHTDLIVNMPFKIDL